MRKGITQEEFEAVLDHMEECGEEITSLAISKDAAECMEEAGCTWKMEDGVKMYSGTDEQLSIAYHLLQKRRGVEDA